MHFTNYTFCRNKFKSNQIKCWFWRRGENRSTWRKTSRSRVENQQTQPTYMYDAESGNRTRATLVGGECCTTARTLLPLVSGWMKCTQFEVTAEYKFFRAVVSDECINLTYSNHALERISFKLRHFNLFFVIKSYLLFS